jgi:hypothetical protein
MQPVHLSGSIFSALVISWSCRYGRSGDTRDAAWPADAPVAGAIEATSVQAPKLSLQPFSRDAYRSLAAVAQRIAA